MRKAALPALLVAFLCLSTRADATDVHSFANTDALQQTHLSLELEADFQARTLAGTATLTLARTKTTDRLVLDTRDLVIRAVRLPGQTDKPPLAFELGERDPVLGRKLTVYLPPDMPERFKVSVRYETSPDASGLQWLLPRQTAGGAHPFLFSQSQAIHARSWIPLQDTPEVRFTYEAAITVPEPLTAVMSAERLPASAAGGRQLFSMRQPVPAYLLAFAVGQLEFEAIGPRTGIYAEPEVLDAAVAEFADTERMLEVSESLFGPYRWDRYDLLILPPSFPYGGMENPRLSFITPTVLAGDKSLVSLIAHELAHSWSGNLVTNASWGDLWLNEGFTVFLEARIMEALYGTRRRIMEERLGYEDLLRDLEKTAPDLQKLSMDLAGKDPDEVFSAVPYEKGRLLLVWLDQQFGHDVMNAFLERYFDVHAFESVTTAEFLAFLERELIEPRPGRVSMEEVRAWIEEPGLPATAPVPPADVFASIDAARDAWLSGQRSPHELDASGWSTHDWLYFLNNMPDSLTSNQLTQLDEAFALTDAGNNEIAHSWLLLAIRHQYRPAWARLERYLTGIGRVKLIRPLYAELMKTPEGQKFARRVFADAAPGYHPQAVQAIDRVVYPDEA